MSETNCPICNSANLIISEKCEICGEDFDKYDLVGTSESVSYILKNKYSKIKIKRADREKFPVFYSGLIVIDLVLVLIIGLSYGQVICGDMGCIAPIFISFILLLISAIIFIISFLSSRRK